MQTQYLDTGDVLPEWADAVIPIENVEPLDEAGNPTVQARSPDRIRFGLPLPHGAISVQWVRI